MAAVAGAGSRVAFEAACGDEPRLASLQFCRAARFEDVPSASRDLPGHRLDRRHSERSEAQRTAVLDRLSAVRIDRPTRPRSYVARRTIASSVRPSVVVVGATRFARFFAIRAITFVAATLLVEAAVVVAVLGEEALFATDHDHDQFLPPHYDAAATATAAAAALFVRAAEDGASDRMRLPLPTPKLPSIRISAGVDDDLPSPLFDRRPFAGTPSWPSLDVVRQRDWNAHPAGSSSSSSTGDDDNRFERARTMMRVEYERISALEASVDYDDAAAAAAITTSFGPLVAPASVTGRHPSPSSGQPVTVVRTAAKGWPVLSDGRRFDASAPIAAHVSSSPPPMSRVRRGSAGETLFVCGAALFLLATTAAAIGFATRRRSRRQSYPCWERELRNGLASPHAL